MFLIKDKIITDDTRISLCLPFIKKFFQKKANYYYQPSISKNNKYVSFIIFDIFRFINTLKKNFKLRFIVSLEILMTM